MKLPAVISLFAGVGGFDLAAHMNGLPVLAAVEIDDHARGVLAHRFPDTRLFTDVTQVKGADLLGDWDGTVVLVGGFPCQDLSIAGKRRGLAGERSGLFWEIIRLAEEIEPSYIILENVPGLLSSNGGRDMGVVIGALGDCGYSVGWRCLDAQYFGIPQRRRRIFIACSRVGNDGPTPVEILALTESGAGDSETCGEEGQDSAGTVEDSPVEGFTTGSHGEYVDGVGTLRANGGDLGGSETLLVPSVPVTTRESATSMSLRTS